jgi:hypothetical protein
MPQLWVVERLVKRESTTVSTPPQTKEVELVFTLKMQGLIPV